MRKRGVKSPDYADAAIYASANLMIQPTDPMASLGIGDMLEMTLMDVFGSDFNKESTISIY
jgi:hypothetical protein